MRAPTLLLVASSIALGGCMAQAQGRAQEREAARTQADLDKALAGLTPGAPTSCIPIQVSPVTTKVYGKVILYRFSNGDVYRNDTSGGCEGSGDDILIQVEHESRPCSGDIVRTVDRDSHIPTGSCALGQFTPYLKARR